jgi:AbiV family abortive infection protein
VKPRSIRQLSELDDAQFFKEIETGLRLCAGNALRLWRDARQLLSPKRSQGFSILQHFAEEEAAKFHILLDAVRCPRQPGEIFSRQLGCFNAHLAKGLYATYYNIFAPADLPEIRRYMDSERKMLYLDGPNDVDWIFQNDIFRKREESIYVDYVDYNDATRRERFWHCPNARMMAIGVWDMRPKVLNVALALHALGLTRAAALGIVAQIWRAATMDDSVRWNDVAALNLKTLQALEEAGLLRNRSEENMRMAWYDWLFPLYPVDLSPVDVKEEDLRQAQRNWSP